MIFLELRQSGTALEVVSGQLPPQYSGNIEIHLERDSALNEYSLIPYAYVSSKSVLTPEETNSAVPLQYDPVDNTITIPHGLMSQGAYMYVALCFIHPITREEVHTDIVKLKFPKSLEGEPQESVDTWSATIVKMVDDYMVANYSNENGVLERVSQTLDSVEDLEERVAIVQATVETYYNNIIHDEAVRQANERARQSGFKSMTDKMTEITDNEVERMQAEIERSKAHSKQVDKFTEMTEDFSQMKEYQRTVEENENTRIIDEAKRAENENERKLAFENFKQTSTDVEELEETVELNESARQDAEMVRAREHTARGELFASKIQEINDSLATVTQNYNEAVASVEAKVNEASTLLTSKITNANTDLDTKIQQASSEMQMHVSQAQMEAQQVVGARQEITEEINQAINGLENYDDTEVRELIQANTEAIGNLANNEVVQGLQTTVDEHTEQLRSLNEEKESIRKDMNFVLGLQKDKFVDSPQAFLELCESGLASKVFNIGDQIVATWTDTVANREYECPIDIVDFLDVEDEDGNVHSGVKIKWHWCTPFGIQFSARQALYYCEEELPAGTYGFTTGSSIGKITNGKKYEFTLTQPVPQGGHVCVMQGLWDQVVENWKIQTYSSQYSTTNIEQVALVEVTELSGTDWGMWTRQGNENLNSMDFANYGDNRYIYSAYRQWLNSDKPKGQWWTPNSKYERVPSELATKDGFLRGFSEEWRAIFKKHKVVTKLNNITTFFNQGVPDYHYDTWHLPSLEEMGVRPQVSGEGSALQYYIELLGSKYPIAQFSTNAEMKHFSIANNTSAHHVRFRSANVGSGCHVWIANSSGYVHYHGAVNSWACAPELDL